MQKTYELLQTPTRIKFCLSVDQRFHDPVSKLISTIKSTTLPSQVKFGNAHRDANSVYAEILQSGHIGLIEPTLPVEKIEKISLGPGLAMHQSDIPVCLENCINCARESLRKRAIGKLMRKVNVSLSVSLTDNSSAMHVEQSEQDCPPMFSHSGIHRNC